MVTDLAKRRNYHRHLHDGSKEPINDDLPQVLVDYTIVYAVAILAHDPEFTIHTDTEQLLRIRQRLCFILEPLMDADDYCSVFYKTLMERTRIHCDALRPDDDTSNAKLRAVCDVAMELIVWSKNSSMALYPSRPAIPPMYFR